MASTILFVIMSIIAGLLLLIVSLTASIGAANISKSTFYNADQRVRSAHQYLIITAALGWSSLAVLVIILIVAAIAGGFTRVEVSEALLTKSSPDKSDLLQAYRGQKELSSGHTTQIVVLVVLIALTIITFALAVLTVLAAIQIGGMRRRDSRANTAYTLAIIAAVAGVGSIAIMIIAVIAYMSVRSAREKQLKETADFVARAEAQLGAPSSQTVISAR